MNFHKYLFIKLITINFKLILTFFSLNYEGGEGLLSISIKTPSMELVTAC